VSYGAGVWLGAIRARTLGPLLPVIVTGDGSSGRDDPAESGEVGEPRPE